MMKNSTLAILAGVGILAYVGMKATGANAATGQQGGGGNAGNYYRNGNLYNQAGNPITNMIRQIGAQGGNYFHGTQGGGTSYSGNRGYNGNYAGSGTAGYAIPGGYVNTSNPGYASIEGGGTGMY